MPRPFSSAANYLLGRLLTPRVHVLKKGYTGAVEASLNGSFREWGP